MLHVPKVHRSRGQKAKDSVKDAHDAFTSNPRTKGFKNRARTFRGNATSGRATNPKTGQTIGAKVKEDVDVDTELSRPGKRLYGAAYGFLGGAVAGNAAGDAVGAKKYPESKDLFKKRAGGFTRITDVGSAGARQANRRWPEFPLKSTIGGATVGAGLGVHGGIQNRKAEARLAQKRKKKAMITPVAKKLNATKDERHRALWYNDDFSPKKSKYTKDERRIAGKIQSKEQLKGQSKGIAVGGAAGAAAGAAAGHLHSKRGAIGAVGGGVVGAITGQHRGDYVGRVKGQRKYKEVLGKNYDPFEVETMEFSKYEKTKGKEQRYTKGRAVAATTLGGYHSLAAGKKGRKARATGRSVGYTVGGSTAGRVAGALVSRGNAGVANAGGAAGGYGASYAAFRENNKRGHYKRQSPDKFTKSLGGESAFGVDHG